MRGGLVGGSAVAVVARQRLRRRRAATVFLFLTTGLTAAVPLALWSASRQTATALDQFLERANAPTANLFVCPPEHDPLVEGPDPCFEYEQPGGLEAIREVPGVTAAAGLAFRPVVLDDVREDTGGVVAGLGISTVASGADAATFLGDPVVLEGRLADEAAPDEVMISEPAAKSIGLGPGDQVAFRPNPLLGMPAGAPAVTSTIVGVVRTPSDLLPLPLESVGGPSFQARSGWVEAHGEQLPGYGATVVWLEDGDVSAFQDRARERLPDNELIAEPVVPGGEADTIEQATGLESRAGLALAATTAVAAAFFVGQWVSRQSRSEGADRATLRALGMSRRQLAAVPAVRWLPVALGGAVVAVALAWAATALGPLGVARRGPWDRSPHLDGPVLLVGAVATAGLVLATAAVAGLFPVRSAAGGERPAQPAAVGAPGLRTGIGLAWASVRRGATLPLVSAVVATALAMAAIITAAGGAASLHLVTAEPHRFGAPWDALVPDGGGFTSLDEGWATLSGVPGIASAAAIVGTDVSIGDDDDVWVQAHAPLGDLPTTPPVMVSGRAPANDREIALGSITLEDAGARVGEELDLRPRTADEPMSYRVVGVAMVTDGFEPNVGHGAVVTQEGLTRLDPTAFEEPEAQVGIEVVDGAGRDRALRALREAVPATVVPFPLPSSLANAERIAELPLLLAAGGAILAAITFAHALIVSVRRNGRELAVCRVIGFTRRQVHTAVTTQAALLALAAVVVGLPLGIIGARWGWRTMARSLGVSTGPLVPAWVVVACGAVAVALAVLAAWPPSGWAARRRPADVLRTE